ncbi:MAG: dihydrodipicolinate synthase family protein [Gammaproteobacteria bacterium]|nr:dihydrodipicolinate synthase family protein [Gammaproteobacteria bacterium]
MADFSGVLPVVPNPFGTDGSVDHESLASVVAYAISCGIKALVYPGVASEDIQLTVDERTACVRTVTHAAAGRVMVIGGGGGALPVRGTRTRRHCHHAGNRVAGTPRRVDECVCRGSSRAGAGLV